MEDSRTSLTQTDFETEGEAVATRTLESTKICRTRLITALLISTLAAALALAVPRAVSYAHGDEGGSKTIFAGGVEFLANSSSRANTGCQEWASNQVGAGKVGATSMEDCAGKCRATPGCGFANFKEGDCHNGADDGTCYLFSWCTPEPSDCWHLQQLPSPTPSPPAQANTGCQEWDANQVGARKVGATNMQDCANKCRATPGCEFANFKEGDCDAIASHDRTCYLLSWCTPEPSGCWHLQQLPSPTPSPPAQANTGCQEWKANQVGGRKVGATNMQDCANKCRATPGCEFANFKEDDCDTVASHDGTCYLLSWCTPEPSDCWRLQQVPSPTPSPPAHPDTGCQEWEANQVGARKAGATNMQDCANKCRATPGCGFANFKEGDCHNGAEDGTCHFFSWCTPEPSGCWHLQQVPSPTPSPRQQAATGCREWQAAQVGAGSVGATNIQDCGNKCKATSGCTLANFNPIRAHGPCYLFNECTPETQDSWTLLKVGSETTTPTPSAIPPQIDNVMSYIKGDRFDTLNFNRCAMVGASNVMKGSNAGGKIDNEYDTVIRLNRPPQPDGEVARDLGVRMDMLFLNHDISLREAVEVMQPSGSAEMTSCSQLEHCRNAAIVQRGDKGCPLDDMASVWGLDRPLVGCVRKGHSDRSNDLRPLAGFEPTTGFQAFMMLVPLCKVLDLYGFGWHGKFDTVDGHYNWDGHNLEEEHLLMDFFGRRDFAGLPSTWDAGTTEWLERHAAQVTKVVGTAP